MVSKLTEERTFIVFSGSSALWIYRPDQDVYDQWDHIHPVEPLWEDEFAPASYDKIVLPAEYLT
jgi:hypothetical protein